jgi:hypothetical protein
MWRPIETAPKDGTRLYLAHSQAAFDGWWEDDVWGDGTEGGWVDGSADRYDEPVILHPTHWLPIPELPTETP